MPNVLLGVTGSVAAMRTPRLAAELQQAGFALKVVATDAALYFFNAAEISDLVVDADEWPGRDAGRTYQRGDRVVHIELRRWADLFVIAPLDANTLAKLACGFCDNCLTCVWRAWDPLRPLVLAPAMNTLMWEHPLTTKHLRSLLSHTDIFLPATDDSDAIIAQINAARSQITIVPPVSKQLACGDIGVGAMADVGTIVEAVRSKLACQGPS